MTEPTITVTLPLDVVVEIARMGCVPSYAAHAVSGPELEVVKACQSALPKPKSPEQVVHGALWTDYGRSVRATDIIAALREAGWLRDTPEPR